MVTKQTTQSDLAAAMTRLEKLEQRRELLNKEHVDAVTARRAALLDGTDDIKILSKVDDRVRACETSLAGLEDALVVIRAKITELSTALATEQDQQQRGQKASEIEARVPRLRDGIAAVAPGLKELIAELRESGKPEGQAAGHLLADAWQQITLETDKIVAELAADARHLRATPTAPVKPSAPPASLLQPQNFRKADLPDSSFVDWSVAR
jgi:hypothetical protein